jgi:hypothetical protein
VSTQGIPANFPVPCLFPTCPEAKLTTSEAKSVLFTEDIEVLEAVEGCPLLFGTVGTAQPKSIAIIAQITPQTNNILTRFFIFILFIFGG